MFQKRDKGQAMVIVLVIGLIIASLMMVGGFKYEKRPAPLAQNTRSNSDIIKPTATMSKRQNLQLEPLNFCKRVPGDEPTCYPNNAGFCCPNDAWAIVRCANQKCAGVDDEGGGSFVNDMADAAGVSACEFMTNPKNYNYPQHPGFPVDEWCASDSCKKIPDGFLCWGKPVILLYPEKTLLVDVEVKTSGEIFISDPLYPPGGWKDVLANPDGSLVYKNKPYKELFYESKVKNYGTPRTGLIFKSSELKTDLPKLLYKLGLNNNETEIPEFMDFWLPKLKDLNSPYIFVSLIEKDVKEKNDKVIINPEPDTRIEIIVYFKPLNKLTDIEPLKIADRPVRRGFTMLEWGGTIDSN